MGTTVLLADAEDYLYFVRRALLGMRDIVLELGDERAGRRPEPTPPTACSTIAWA